MLNFGELTCKAGQWTAIAFPCLIGNCKEKNENFLHFTFSLVMNQMFKFLKQPDQTSSQDCVGVYRLCLTDILHTLLLHLSKWDNLHLYYSYQYIKFGDIILYPW